MHCFNKYELQIECKLVHDGKYITVMEWNSKTAMEDIEMSRHATEEFNQHKKDLPDRKFRLKIQSVQFLL